jgi:hypothetical protein
VITTHMKAFLLELNVLNCHPAGRVLFDRAHERCVGDVGGESRCSYLRPRGPVL